MSQLAPGITTATGTLAKTYRKAGAKMPSTSKAQHNSPDRELLAMIRKRQTKKKKK